MLNVANLKPAKAAPIKRSRGTSRDLGPNPWLDKNWPFNLQASYDNAEAYNVTVTGAQVDGVISKGKDKGKPVKRYTGDVQDSVTLIRDAATKLNIGVAVDVQPAKVKGHFVVTYQGQKRKAARKPKVATPTVPGTGAPVAPGTPAPVVPQSGGPKV